MPLEKGSAVSQYMSENLLVAGVLQGSHLGPLPSSVSINAQKEVIDTGTKFKTVLAAVLEHSFLMEQTGW